MTSLEYILQLCEVASTSLGVKFTKTTPSRLQTFADQNGSPFIALVGVDESTTEASLSRFLPTFDLAFVTILETSFEASDEEITEKQIEADKLTKRFRYLLNKNKYTTVTGFTTQELFRNGSFSGIGKAFSMSVQLPDYNDYCDLDCNTDVNGIC